jgi:hypothetical protein
MSYGIKAEVTLPFAIISSTAHVLLSAAKPFSLTLKNLKLLTLTLSTWPSYGAMYVMIGPRCDMYQGFQFNLTSLPARATAMIAGAVGLAPHAMSGDV